MSRGATRSQGGDRSCAGHGCCCQGNNRHQEAPGLLPRLPFLGPSHWTGLGAPVWAACHHEDSPKSPRLPAWSQANNSSFHSESCRKEGRGDLQVINRSTSCKEGEGPATERSEAVTFRRAEQGPGSKQKNPAEEGRASSKRKGLGAFQHLGPNTCPPGATWIRTAAIQCQQLPKCCWDQETPGRKAEVSDLGLLSQHLPEHQQSLSISLGP